MIKKLAFTNFLMWSYNWQPLFCLNGSFWQLGFFFSFLGAGLGLWQLKHKEIKQFGEYNGENLHISTKTLPSLDFQTAITNICVENHYRSNIISCFCVSPLVHGLFKREVLKCVEALCVELNARIQMGGLNLFFMNVLFEKHCSSSIDPKT